MTVPRRTSSDKTEEGTRHVFAFAAATYDLDGIKRTLAEVPGLVPPNAGGTVLLKPNLLAPRAPGTAVVTHPVIVQAVAELFLDAGWKVLVGDSSAYAPSAVAMRAAGYNGFMKKLSLEAADMATPVAVSGRRFKKLLLAKAVVEADLLVNLPKLKTHGQTGLTLAVKNLFGCVPGLNKAQWHLATGRDAKLFSFLLLDIAGAAGAHFSVLDGVEGMDGRGPSRGRARKVGGVFASDDCTALDLAVTQFLGGKTSSVTTLRYYEEFSGVPLPRVSLEMPPVDAEPPAAPGDFDFIEPGALSRPYLFPERLWGLLRNLVSPYPVVLDDRCDTCETCVDVCPADAGRVNETEGKVEVDYDKCIRCFCCEEVCPKGAMVAKVPLLGRVLGRKG